MRRLDGIAPRFDAVRDTRTDEAAFGTLPDLVGPHGPVTRYLPGFEPQPRTIVPAPILILYEGAGGKYVRRARPAPLALRLLYEVLMSVSLDKRESRSILDVQLRDIRDWLYPVIESASGRRRRSYEPRKHLGPIQAAIQEVHNLRVEVIPKGDTVPTLWLPVSARKMPTRHLDSAVSFEVYLPPGGGSGALVDRRVLRLLGLRSALMYRAYIGLCYFWDHYGYTENGQRALKSTRPVVLRDERGQMVNRAGELILDKSGKPSLQWKRGTPLDAEGRTTTWEFAAREPSPNALARYPVLNNDDLLHLCYPGDGIEPRTASRRDKLRMARNALRQMRDDGHIIILEDSTSSDGNATRLAHPSALLATPSTRSYRFQPTLIPFSTHAHTVFNPRSYRFQPTLFLVKQSKGYQKSSPHMPHLPHMPHMGGGGGAGDRHAGRPQGRPTCPLRTVN